MALAAELAALLIARKSEVMALAAELAALLTARKSEAAAGGGFGFEGSGGKSVADAGGAFGSGAAFGGAAFGGGAGFSTSTAPIGVLSSRTGSTFLSASFCNPRSDRLLSTAPFVEESGPLREHARKEQP